MDVTHAELLAGTAGTVHSWELVTAVDGPGTRLTVFLPGCPLRCLYCHNPDMMRRRSGTKTSVHDVLARVARYRDVFGRTGGGLTLSGGEPLSQPAFVRRLLRGAKELGVHTAVDTSGLLGARCTDDMLDDTDLVLLDVKAGTPDLYTRVTGRRLEPTLAFGRRIAAHGGPKIWVRYVLVPGLTDDPDSIGQVADYVASFGPAVARVEVLPFHQMGRGKWDRLGLDYALDDVRPPGPHLVEHVRQRLGACGVAAH